MGTKTYAILDYNTFGVLARTTDRPDQQDFATELVKRWNAYPDLLDALEAVMEAMEWEDSNGPEQAAYDQARAAIANAEQNG